MVPPARAISWIKAARKQFQRFPKAVQNQILDALAIAALGETPDPVKPLKGFGSGVLEIVLRYRGDSFRAVYAVKLDEDLWVVHAFQKKSTKGIKTPKPELDVVRDRLKRLKEQLR